MEFTHLNERGEAHMVDVGEKPVTVRTALAGAALCMKPETLESILQDTVKKGSVFAVARVAGIMAAKRTPELVPLCHGIPLDSVEVEFFPVPPGKLRIEAAVRCTARTGAEMEALTAASVAALTVYDMCKAVDRGMRIEDVRLMKKTGGRSGTYERGEA